MPETFIPPHGGYERLLSFQKARIVYDGTVHFCGRLVDRRDRTHDQMVQAARSGKQNILEGSQASGTSKEAEIKLTNVARPSLEELLEDYRDFLRRRGLAEWNRDHPLHAPASHPRPASRRQLRNLPPRHRAPRPRHRRQCVDRPHQADQLSPRPPTPPARASLHPSRRPARTHDPRPPPRTLQIPPLLISFHLLGPLGPFRPFRP